MTRHQMVGVLAKYRRPGSPMYEHHFQGLPVEVVKRRNVPSLLAILRDRSLPARVRDHAAGALGEVGDGRTIRPLIEALGEAGTRRGAAVALGRMRAREAAEALTELAPRLRAAQWALSQLGTSATAEEAIDDLRSGHLRLIPQKLRSLSKTARQEVKKHVCRELAQVVSDRTLGPEHRWLVTSLQHLAPPEAGDVVTEALRQSIHLKNCCGCTRNRLMRTAGAIRPPQAVPALADVICKVGNPDHKHRAAVCIEKILKARPLTAAALLRDEESRLCRELNRLRKAVAVREPTTPPKPRSHTSGSPRWFAASDRAIKAITRVLVQCGRQVERV